MLAGNERGGRDAQSNTRGVRGRADCHRLGRGGGRAGHRGRRLDAAAHAGRPSRHPGHLDQLRQHAVRDARRRGPGTSCAARLLVPGHERPGPPARRRGPPQAGQPADRVRGRPVRRAAQCTAPVHGGRPAERPGAGASGSRGDARLQPRQPDRFLAEPHPVGALHHARRARRHLPGRLRRRLPDPAIVRLRGDLLRDDPRGPHHPARPSAPAGRHPTVERRPARPLGGRHAGDRDDQLQRQGNHRHEHRHARHPRPPADRGAAPGGALHAVRAGHDRLRGDDRRSRLVHPHLDRGHAAEPGPDVPDIRVRLPRRELRPGEQPQRGREARRTRLHASFPAPRAARRGCPLPSGCRSARAGPSRRRS